jgi:PAS domain S-box-containing protein
MWKLLFSLRYRIILSIVVIEVVMLSIMVWANTTEVRETHSERLAQSVDVIMQQFTTTVGRYLIEADYASLEEYANAVMQHDELDYIVVLDVWDEVLLKVGKAPDLQGLRPIPSVSREGVLDVSGGIVFGGKPRGAVRMGFSLAQVERTVQEALNRGVAIAATEIVLSIIAAFLLGHVLTRNLKTLSLAAEHFGRGEAGVVLSARGRDEVAQVAGAFNRMVGERKRAEEALRKSEEQVRLLLECAGEGIYGLDLEGRCTFANAECLRLLGYDDVGALLGENMHELIHHTRPDGSPYPQSECLILQAFRKGAGTHCDGEVLWRADGTCFPAEYRSFPVVREGETIGAVINFSDITERKQAAEALGESEQLFSRAFHASPALFAIASPEDGKLYDVNETWLATLGYDREEVLKHSVLELGIWVDPKERARFVERLRTERSVPEFEARFRTKAGEELACSWSPTISPSANGPRRRYARARPCSSRWSTTPRPPSSSRIPRDASSWSTSPSRPGTASRPDRPSARPPTTSFRANRRMSSSHKIGKSSRLGSRSSWRRRYTSRTARHAIALSLGSRS